MLDNSGVRNFRRIRLTQPHEFDVAERLRSNITALPLHRILKLEFLQSVPRSGMYQKYQLYVPSTLLSTAPFHNQVFISIGGRRPYKARYRIGRTLRDCSGGRLSALRNKLPV